MTIGFHLSSAGNPTGIGDYMRRLDAAGIPFFIKSTDSYGVCHEATQYTNAKHVIIYRMSTAGQNDGVDYDVPPYDLDPYYAAVVHWEATFANLPPEFNRERVWIEPVNEVDKNRSEWLAEFAIELAMLAHSAGYKVTMPAWSSGEPEVIDERPWLAWLPYLRLCAQLPEKTAAALHEYNLYHEPWENVYPWNIGRFQWLLEECDRNGIARPTVHVTEYGWSLDRVPSWEDAKEQIAQTSALYARFKVAGGAIWNLGKYQNTDVHNQTQRLIKPLTDWILANPQPAGSPTEPLDPRFFDVVEPPTADNWKEVLWRQSIDEQLLRLNPDAALQRAIFDRDFVPVSNEFAADIGGVAGAAQAAEHLGTGERRVFFAAPPSWEVAAIADPAIIEPPPPVVLPFDVIVDELPTHPTKEYATRPLSDITHVVIHHTAGSADATPEQIARFHIDARDWPGIAYHFYIGPNGEAWQTNRLETISYHVGGQNGHSIGVALAGNFTNESPPQAQLDAAGRVIDWIHGRLPQLLTNSAHKLMPGQQTACPGATSAEWLGELGIEVPGAAVDILDYLRGDGRRYEVQTSWGPQESMQTQRIGNEFYHVKGVVWEQLAFGEDYIYRGIDTSPEEGLYYTLEDDDLNGWSRWLPRRMKVGESFHRAPIVRWFDKSDCSPLNSDRVPDWIRLVAVHERIRFGLTGIELEDVVELVWTLRHNGAPDESYFYAKGFGLVGWKKHGVGKESAISEIHAPGARPDLIREVIPCL